MLVIITFAVCACIGLAAGHGDWGFGYDLPACPEESRAPLGKCFETAHGSVRPCLAELMSNPAYHKCRKAIAKEQEEEVYPSASNKWMGASRTWHSMFMECMGVQIPQSRRRRATASRGYDKTCFDGVKKAMADCEEMAMRDCEQYKICMEREDVATARAKTSALQEIKSMKLSLCMSDYEKYVSGSSDLEVNSAEENNLD